MSFARQHVWTDVVHLGDLLEGDAISGHNKGKPKLVEGERLEADYAMANALLCEVEAAAPKAKIALLKGNHEYRVDRYIEEHPALDGLINVEKGLRIADRPRVQLIDCYPAGELYNIGKLYFTHGTYCGGNPCKKHLDVYGVNIVFGHTHEVGIYSKVTYGKGKALSAYNLGCLCRYDMAYLEGRPTNWQHAIGEAYVLPNGKFNLVIHNIFDGEFVVHGKKYSWRQN